MTGSIAIALCESKHRICLQLLVAPVEFIRPMADDCQQCYLRDCTYLLQLASIIGQRP